MPSYQTLLNAYGDTLLAYNEAKINGSPEAAKVAYYALCDAQNALNNAAEYLARVE
jgi:hypothetical protein